MKCLLWAAVGNGRLLRIYFKGSIIYSCMWELWMEAFLGFDLTLRCAECWMDHAQCKIVTGNTYQYFQTENLSCYSCWPPPRPPGLSHLKHMQCNRMCCVSLRFHSFDMIICFGFIWEFCSDLMFWFGSSEWQPNDRIGEHTEGLVVRLSSEILRFFYFLFLVNHWTNLCILESINKYKVY